MDDHVEGIDLVDHKLVLAIRPDGVYGPEELYYPVGDEGQPLRVPKLTVVHGVCFAHVLNGCELGSVTVLFELEVLRLCTIRILVDLLPNFVLAKALVVIKQLSSVVDQWQRLASVLDKLRATFGSRLELVDLPLLP